MRIGEQWRWFLSSIYVAAIIYILTAFGVGSFNPAEWGAAQCFLFLIGSVLILGAGVFLFED